MSKKEKLVDSVFYHLAKVNDDGLKEFAAWFKYYFNMEYVLINLLTEEQVRHCYVVIQDLAAKKEFRK